MRKHHSNMTPRQLGIVLAALFIVGAFVAGITRTPAEEADAITPTFNNTGSPEGRALMAVAWRPADKREKPATNMVKYKGFDVAFNPEMHVPNYVVWELTGAEAKGETPRRDKFEADPRVDGCATPDDYRYSGYDRGHMAPAGDMKWDSDAMDQSFRMTNICPQAKKLNTGAWRNLEQKCREKAMLDSAIIIVAGPIFDKEGPKARIGGTGVAVPDAFFKVILSPYTNPAKGIGFIMPNWDAPGGMQPYAVSIDSVESLTGYDFFHALPDDVETAVEQQSNFHKWSRNR